MAYFSSVAELDCFVGGVLRLACIDPTVAEHMAGSSTSVRLESVDPDASFTVVLGEPTRVLVGQCPVVPDVVLTTAADLWHQFWRGEYSLVDGLARGEVSARGPISRVLKLLPTLEPLFPAYRAMVERKDAWSLLEPLAV